MEEHEQTAVGITQEGKDGLGDKNYKLGGFGTI